MDQKKLTWVRVIALDMLLLCYALSTSLVGQMFDSIKGGYGLTLSQGGLLLSIQSVGGLLLAVMCILFIGSINKTKLLVVCGFGLSILMMLMGVALPLAPLFVIFGLLGFSGGAVNTLSNAVMADTVPQRAERYINFMHMLFSFGSVIAPVLSQAIFPSMGLLGVFLIFGGFALCWAVFSVYAFKSSIKAKWATRSVSFKPMLTEAMDILKIPGMGLIFVCAILITSWQLSAIYYISSLFTGITGDPMKGALALSLLFLGMMVSRLIYSRFADRFSKGLVLLLTNAVALAGWVAVFLVQDVTVKYILIVLTTLACGNNFPITYSAGCRLAPSNTAAATGFVNLGYYIALFVFIPIIGALGDSIGLGNALLLSGVMLFVLLPISYLLHRRMGTQGTKADSKNLP